MSSVLVSDDHPAVVTADVSVLQTLPRKAAGHSIQLLFFLLNIATEKARHCFLNVIFCCWFFFVFFIFILFYYFPNFPMHCVIVFCYLFDFFWVYLS